MLQVGSIPELGFTVRGARTLEYAAAPTIVFELELESRDGQPIRSVLLETQIQIAARRRGYDGAAEERLLELFGTPDRWSDTLRTLLWAHVTKVVPPFDGATVVELPVVCSYDLDVVASRYFDALDDGFVPLEFLFNGSVFYAGEDGRLQTARIALTEEAGYRMPVELWKQTMERHFHGTAWLRLRKESFDRLQGYKARKALPTVDDAVDSLLEREER